MPSAPSPTPSARPRRIVKRNAKSIGTPSVMKALNGEFEDSKEQLSSKEQFEAFSSVDEVEPFTREQLEEKWKAFLPRLEDRPSLKVTLSVLPDLKEDYTLELPIDNRIQDELLVNIKPELVSYLRKELRNSKINLITKVAEIKRDKVIYSDIEKYQEMARRNPALALLKKELSLDF